jgi:hypothetical protein
MLLVTNAGSACAENIAVAYLAAAGHESGCHRTAHDPMLHVDHLEGFLSIGDTYAAR